MLTKPTFAVDNVQKLDNLVKDQATTVKQTFDKVGADIKEYLENQCEEIDALNTAQTTALNNHKTSADHDERYYTKTDLNPYLRSGDTIIKEEVFTIVNSNDGEGHFTYLDKNSNIITGDLDESGNQIFTLLEGNYEIGQSRIEAVINDTLRRSEASGGLVGVSTTKIKLTDPQGDGAEITFRYYEKIGIVGTGLVVISETDPGKGYIWFKVVS